MKKQPQNSPRYRILRICGYARIENKEVEKGAFVWWEFYLKKKSKAQIWTCRTVFFLLLLGFLAASCFRHNFNHCLDQLPDGNQDMEQDPAVGEGFKKTNHKLLPQVAYVAYQVHRSCEISLFWQNCLAVAPQFMT